MAELLPCPFCGSRDAYMMTEHDSDGLGFFLNIKCGSCRAASGQQYVSHGNDCPQTRAEVREAWNRRATPAEGAQSQDAQDARRYRAFFESGLPVCFRGDEFYSKTECDSAIDAAIERSDKGSLAALGEQGK
jgi:Lar family restriction alleviation protein